MNKQEKVHVVDSLQKKFLQYPASLLINFQGLTVGQMQLLRKMLRSHGSSLKITKARLMRRAVSDVEGGDQFQGFLKNQVGLVFIEKDSSVIVKMLHDFSKEHTSFKLVAGLLEHKVFNMHDIVRIAQLPSKEVLLAQLCGILAQPLKSFVSTLNAPAASLVQVVKQIAEIKSR